MGQTYYSPRRPRPQRDPLNNNAITWPRSHTSEVDTYKVDIAGELDSGETCSSISIVDNVGVTVSSSSVSSAGLVAVTISAGLGGYLLAKITTSASRVIPVPMQWKANEGRTRDAYRKY